MSDQMSFAGYGCDDQGHLNPSTEQLDYRMPFTDAVQTFGMPITVAAYFGMLNNFYKQLIANPELLQFFNGTFFVDFSKASLLRILSQEGCEFVRFHFAIPEANNKISLVAEGLTLSQDQVGYPQLLAKATTNTMVHDAIDPKIEERGNGAPYPPPLKALFDLLRAQGSPLATVDLGTIL
ncbi:hypothetical protein FHW36_109174 [Chitinophaga polysaccharea]|uniref:Uncharacterized protein n=1 Tax=Chitinophaga polysaccharea TaxID=1293035 RepID=A0A561PB67_9BACT|nr:hypothetical protein [Chitinophaga polysaccharea]TWF35384.1 hypothetical protein FHW36_109174 [Chitinophaga polysaccharea]